MNQQLKVILVCTILFSSGNAFAACVGSTAPGGPCATVPDKGMPIADGGASAVKAGDVIAGKGDVSLAAAKANPPAGNECGCSFLMTPNGVVLMKADGELKK